MTASAFLEIEGLSKSFGDVRVLEDLSLDLAEGEILALLGLSGSGKTTALRLLAGFEQPDRGAIRLGGEAVGHLGPDRRGFGMVFQHYALFPHMTVAENVAFGLEAQGWAKERVGPRVAEMLALVDLASFAERRVSAISGGQQQRVALARALAPEPRLLLLDEPLSNLDPALRERTRSELRAAVKRIGITTVLVTHEQEEAFHVGDRIAVLNGGRLEQVGSARELYREPATRFVASFVGRSGMPEGTVADAVRAGDEVRVRLDGRGGRSVAWSGVAARDSDAGTRATLWVRPESLTLADESDPTAIPGRVLEHRFVGALTYAVVETGAGRLEVEIREETTEPVSGEGDGEAGRAVWVAPKGEGQRGPAPRIFPLVPAPSKGAGSA